MGQESNTVEEPKAGERENTTEVPKAEEKPDPGAELRKAPRLQCSGLAGIQTLPAVEKPCPAKIINLSIGGCLMEFERPLQLATDEIVELIFCVNHMPFRVRGQVRAIRSETLVGFQFPMLSDRIRRQLEDLVGELIDHLKKLHQESVAKNSSQDDAKPIRNPAVLAPHAPLPCRPIKPVEVRPDKVAVRPEPARRWF
ncbi:MAG: PilZ domain-containing protein [Terracidiphilus sp.]|jgi:hypothetical protein